MGSLINTTWHEWEMHGRDRHIVLCVETGIELRPGRDGFDARAVDSLVEEATRLMRASPSPIDRVRIIPVSRGNG